MPDAPNNLLTDLLRDVSRSFYLTLRVLPKSIRAQVGLAYLLARTSDTIADTALVPLAQRLELLRALRERIFGNSKSPLNIGELMSHQTLPAERVLLEKCELSLALLQTLSRADFQLVRDVLEIIISGQELDLTRFAGGSAEEIVALKTDEDLDDYTYRVAGCVGEFWTKICRAYLFPDASLNDAFLLTNGVRFGKGLQLVNILRDIPADLRNGRCYLPLDKLSSLGLSPNDLLDARHQAKLRPLYDSYLDSAREHLTAGWDYTNVLPWRNARVRLACAWPVLIGLKTIERLRGENFLDAARRIKISRCEVRKIIFQSLLFYPLPFAWRKLAAPTGNRESVASGWIFT